MSHTTFTPPPSSPATSRDVRIVEALQAYRVAADAGEPIDRGELLRQYDDVADELAGCLDNLDFIANIAPQLQPGDSSVSRPASLGDFRIIRELGRGGMGVVYEAEQLSLERRVALKVLPYAAMLDECQLKRFKNEARAAATLKHDNIVSVHSVGTDRGVHYYAMELIEGLSLAEVIAALQQSRVRSPAARAGEDCASRNAPAERAHRQHHEPNCPSDTVVDALSTQRSTNPKQYFDSIAELGIQAARALDHAHQQGIIHRDVKPGNLMLDANGKLLITDFGLARIGTDTTMTMTGDLVGTLRYMSPEQALGDRTIDHRSDVYSLGITLYELVTGRCAFTGSDRQQLLQQITNDEPKPPRQFNSSVPRNLETIILKAIAKNPDERFATAQQLADDLHRFTRSLPITAKRQSRLSKARHWVCRNRTVAALGGIAMLLLLTLAIAGPIAAFQQANAVRTESQLVKRLTQLTRRQRISIYARDMQQAQRLLDEGNHFEAQETLLNWVPAKVPDDALDDANSDLRGFEWFHLWHRCIDPAIVRSFYHELPVRQAVFLAGGHELAVSGFGDEIAVWNLKDAEATTPRCYLRSPAQEVDRMLHLPKSGLVVTGDKDGNLSLFDPSTGARLQTVRFDADSYSDNIVSLAVDDRERILVVGTGGRQVGAVHVLDLADWRQRHSFPMPAGARAVIGPAGELIVACLDRQEISVLDLESGNHVRAISLQRGSGQVMAISSGRSILAIAVRKETSVHAQYGVELWDTTGWQRIWSHDVGANIVSIAFSDGGNLLAFGSESGDAWIADISSGSPRLTVHRRIHDGSIRDIDFLQDASQLATCGSDGFATIWSVTQLSRRSDGIVSQPAKNSMSYGACFLDEQGTVAVTTSDGEAAGIWDTISGSKLHEVKIKGEGNSLFMASAPKVGRCCMISGVWPHPSNGDPPGRVLVWDNVAEDLVCDVQVPMNIGNSMTSCAISPDGKFVVANSHRHGVVLVDVDDNEFLRTFDIYGKTLRFSADGKLLTIGDGDGFVHVLAFPSLETLSRVRMDERLVDCVDISSDGKLIAAAGYDNALKIFDLESNEISILGTLQAFTCLVRFSPCGKQILTGDLDRRICLWNRESGTPIIQWRIPFSAWPTGEFSADGSAVVIGGWRTELVIHAPLAEKLRQLSVAALQTQACRNVTFTAKKKGR